MNIFDEIPYDVFEIYMDELYGYSESTEYEFMSDDELERLEEEVWK